MARILEDPYDEEEDDWAIESEETVKIKGHDCQVYWCHAHWEVWLEGRGTIGFSSNREGAIEDAEETIT